MTQRLMGLLLLFVGLSFLLVGVVACASTSSATPAQVSRSNASPTLSSQAAALATIWAAPPHPAPVVQVELASADSAPASSSLASSSEELSADALRGQDLFNSACSACHGLEAVGVSGLGPNLATSEFVHGLNDDEMVQFIIRGRDPWDMENKSGIAMPSRGGNPAISNDDLYAIVAYLRSLD